MIRLPFIAAGLAFYVGARYVSRRRRRGMVRLRDGRRVRLLSSVALLGDSASDLLALEYVSLTPDPQPDDLGDEARSLVETVGARPEYASCRSAVVTVRRRASADRGPTFAFRRGDRGSDWHPADGRPG